MKYLLMGLTTALTFACTDKNVSVKKHPDLIANETIDGQYLGSENNDPRLANAVLDLRGAVLNQPISMANILGCGAPYVYGSSANTGIPQGSMLITSSDGGKTGQISFGNLPYVDPTEVGMPYSAMVKKHPVCSTFTTESYDFEVVGNTLKLYAIAPGKSWDGAMSEFFVGAPSSDALTKGSFTGDAMNDPRLANVVLDLTNIPLNTEVDANLALPCSGYLLGSSNSTVDLHRGEGTMTIVSSTNGRSGQIHFGHLPYVHPSEQGTPRAIMTQYQPLCELFTKESYNFEIDSNGDLIIKAIAPGKSWDGIENKFFKN